MWCHMQLQLDQGVQWCGLCEQFGTHYYCGACGRRFGERMRECPACRTYVSTDYCVACGTRVASDFLRRYESGQVNWTPYILRAQGFLSKLLQDRPDMKRDLYPEMADNQAGMTLPERIMDAFRGL